MEANIWLHWANLSPECTAVQLQKYGNNEDEKTAPLLKLTKNF